MPVKPSISDILFPRSYKGVRFGVTPIEVAVEAVVDD